MTVRWLPVAVVVLLAGCSGEAEDSTPAQTSTTTTSTTAPATTVVYRGDPRSEFCLRLMSDDQPIADPFEAGLDPSDVEVRFLALQRRFEALAEVAPPELDPDLDELVDGLAALGDGLDRAGYDFEELAALGADVRAFDDQRFAVIGERVSAYREQVCER